MEMTRRETNLPQVSRRLEFSRVQVTEDKITVMYEGGPREIDFGLS